MVKLNDQCGPKSQFHMYNKFLNPSSNTQAI